MTNLDRVCKPIADELRESAAYHEITIRECINKGKYYTAYYLTIDIYDTIKQRHLFLSSTISPDTANKYLGKLFKRGTRLKNAMNNLINFESN